MQRFSQSIRRSTAGAPSRRCAAFCRWRMISRPALAASWPRLAGAFMRRLSRKRPLGSSYQRSECFGVVTGASTLAQP
ncbi:conserved hypothetical protein [Ricinus communis]|uniref:Uncharacterized protein n=1 Tax=Ricinus communis TaxID=3988 RepID=B9TL49_RICCO|nr:conserved hypothetical protein [Ricinus communis]